MIPNPYPWSQEFDAPTNHTIIKDRDGVVVATVIEPRTADRLVEFSQQDEDLQDKVDDLETQLEDLEDEKNDLRTDKKRLENQLEKIHDISCE